jgi:lipoprotein-anchoring transpeptidase ErfK/SrfK
MRSPVSNSELENVTLTDANDAVRAQVFAQVWGERADDLADQVEVLAADQAAYQAQAESAAATAEAREAEVQARVEELRVARAQQRKLAAQVEDKLERALSESASLAQLDKTLSDQIARESQRYRAPRGGGGGGGSLPQAGNVSVRTVGGITVATSIADNVERLLAAASADGISFGGGGYRNSSSQIALRRSNCGSSNYAIYQMPASQCSPPTARPGASMHERGLAIDFTYNGRVINSRSNPGYLWLKANASKYGLYNLPSEPWHWSVNGN